MPLDLVEGWTGPIDYDLKTDGVLANLSSSNGDVVTVVLTTRGAQPVSTTGEVTFLTSSTGRVRYLPSSGDLLASRSPYRVRWKIVNSCQAVFFPSADAEVWTVHPL